jgi:hypothetical protein
MKSTFRMRARSSTANALMQTSRHEGCPVCMAIGEEMVRVMDGWNYEGFSDVQLRQQWRHAQGFCPLHTWQLAEKNNAFQLALIYHEIVEDLLDQEDAALATLRHSVAPSSGGWRSWLERWGLLRPSHHPSPAPSSPTCFFCGHRQHLEQRYGETLVALLESDGAPDWLAQSTGLCRRHMQQAVSTAQAEPSSPHWVDERRVAHH